MQSTLYSILLLLVFAFTSLQAQTVTGIILNTSDEPLAGATVHIDGQNQGVLSYTDGRFRIRLNPGSYTLNFRYLGYADRDISIELRNDTNLVVRLQRADLELSTVEITRGKRDPAYDIIKKVISQKKSFIKQFDSYSCESYMKLRLEQDTMLQGANLRALIDSLGKDNLPEPGDNRALKTLIESVSDIYYKSPGRYKTVVKGYYNSADRLNPNSITGRMGSEFGSSTRDPYLFYQDVSDVDINFYKNLIQAPVISDRPLISPLHDLLWTLTYRYKLVSTVYEGSKVLYEIKVEPLNSESPTFTGTIWIEKDSYAIRKLEMDVNPATLIYFRSLSIDQHYQIMEDGRRTLKLERFQYTIKDGKVWLFGENETSYRRYELDVKHPRARFNNELRRTEQEAYERDSTFWVQNRPLALQASEKVFKYKQDSIKAYMISPGRLAELDSMYNQNDILDFLFNGVTFRSRVHGTRYYFNSLVEQFQPFGVGGYRHSLGGSFSKTFKNFTRLDVIGDLNYGFNNNDLKGGGQFRYMHDPVSRAIGAVRFGDRYTIVNQAATIANILSRGNFVRRINVGAGYARDIANGLRIAANVDFADRIPIDDLQRAAWSDSLFGDNNRPVSFDPYREFILRLTVTFTPGNKFQMEPYRKINLGSKWPTFGFRYQKAIPGIAGSELNYDKITFLIDQEFTLGTLGTSRWRVRAGRFLQTKNVRFTDLKFIRGTDPYFFAAPLDVMQLLGPTISTQKAWFEGHYLHDFRGLLINKIPFLKKLPLQTQAGGGLLALEDNNFLHAELFAGIGVPLRIRRTRFKLAAYYVTSYTNVNNALQGQLKFGISIYDPIRRRWNF